MVLFSPRLIGLAAAAVCLSSLSCSDDDPEPEPETMGIRLQVHTTFGQVLTDGAGRALYFFALDADGNSACAGNCLSLWPPYHHDAAAPGEGIDREDIGTVALADGTMQTTYKGWPLYYYSGDGNPGEITGDGVGGNWFVAKPDYTVMLVSHQLVGGDGTAYTADLTPGEGLTAYLVDAYGRTLYGFRNDRYNTNNFTNPDFSNDGVWPIYDATLQTVPSAVNRDDFASITVHGRTQLTYKGWPLYYFGQDVARGETKGIDFPAVGVWPVLGPDSPEATAP
ncbi:Predicted lipoprotein with conserved Yx(FWY)xxD motif [Parapedobacter luteus]|uniref:Predicted lipoprotein with conserved Yx(FWY)xxD motif n=2 Tax=Sphingobacteriaceae TaxID=84566 RepID=A0A1T5A4Q3_9SPHI|nr:Predicted lipoprotein with conserved Yx(FWY)xxD motif [Parapedobacter luteus]